ncbi:MAG: hypothetical protein MMC33_007727 [Icmadophila ericetorum]|nr:hypothetical protein [Icmadophila ericetorum]
MADTKSSDAPNILIIGAGSRGNAYAYEVHHSTPGRVVAVAEPITFKRHVFGSKYIWGIDGQPQEGQEFVDWKDFINYEKLRRQRVAGGEKEDALPKVDGVFVCTLDETHVDIVTALAALGDIHIMCEKPLATTLDDCLKIYRGLMPESKIKGITEPRALLSVGHVLRYSPHNIMLRDIVRSPQFGEIVSIEHTEPVGWWHFAHSYVRGNWRKESRTAPSLLTKSCHDIDLLLWLLCAPPADSDGKIHLPSSVSSVGSLSYFKKSRKPKLAGDATNCLSCSAEKTCKYSAKELYYSHFLAKGSTGWPVSIVDPEIGDCLSKHGLEKAKGKLMERLAEDYTKSTPQADIEDRPWFGRCVYEADNDVCDDQIVTIKWEDEQTADGQYKGAKTALLHMIALTEQICQRRGRIYGTEQEIEYDSEVIRVHDFAAKSSTTYRPRQMGGGHGGGDKGLALQYVNAIDAVKNHGKAISEAQNFYIGCDLNDVIRSHAMVFAAEEARREQKVVNWKEWWSSKLHG